MTKRMLMLTALLATASVGLLAHSKPEFSLRIHLAHNSYSVRDDITLEVTTTNLTDRTLDPMKWTRPYTYIVQRDGLPAPKIEQSEMISLPKGLPPHRSVYGYDYVQHYVDMSQPGKYTIQLEKDGVKSNVVRVTVEP